MLSPAPAERMAVLETRLLPGRALRMDCAVSFGSLEGTEGGWGVESASLGLLVVKAVAAGRVVRRSVGRVERTAPGRVCQWELSVGGRW